MSTELIFSAWHDVHASNHPVVYFEHMQHANIHDIKSQPERMLKRVAQINLFWKS